MKKHITCQSAKVKVFKDARIVDVIYPEYFTSIEETVRQYTEEYGEKIRAVLCDKTLDTHLIYLES